MKKAEIRVGGLYLAKVNGRIVTVRVDDVREWGVGAGKRHISYDVTNLSTGRKTTFRSAAKFRGAAPKTTERGHCRVCGNVPCWRSVDGTRRCGACGGSAGDWKVD